MSEPDRSSPSFPYLPILMIISTVAGLYLWTYKPLTSSRPELNEAQQETYENKVRARLWEDPILSVENSPEYKMYSDCKKQNTQNGLCNTIASNLPQTIDTNNIDIRKTTVLFVMIDGNDYSESYENRLRTRYAVVNALGFAGYLPMDAEHLRFMELCLSDTKNTTKCKKKDIAIIPYEWYEIPESDRSDHSLSNFVLVLWAKNEDFKEKFFDKQKELEKYLGEEIAKNNPSSVFNRSQIKIIGPTNSPTLEAMFNDLIIPTKKNTSVIFMTTPRDYDMYDKSTETISTPYRVKKLCCGDNVSDWSYAEVINDSSDKFGWVQNDFLENINCDEFSNVTKESGTNLELHKLPAYQTKAQKLTQLSDGQGVKYISDYSQPSREQWVYGKAVENGKTYCGWASIAELFPARYKKNSDSNNAVDIFSPWASVASNLILRDLFNTDKLSSRGPGGLYWGDYILYKIFSRNGYNLNQPTKSDYDLAKTMVNELCNRGLLDSKYCNENNNIKPVNSGLLCDHVERLTKGSRNSKIVLISEWDTNYGRNLPLAFAMAFCDNVQGSNKILQENYTDRFKLIDASERLLKSGSVFLKYSYLRGIDGKTGSEQDETKSTTSNSGNSSSEKKDSPEDEKKKLEIPEGNSQLDYFRRLAQEIKTEDENLRSQCDFLERISDKCGIKAIGVLGSDVYDKLLVMHALKAYFPDTQFFTTDLDSRLYHEREMDATRNLLVASDFGLELNPNIKGETKIPPFRDNLQTATFVSTLMAVGFIKKDNIDGMEKYIINQYDGTNLIVPVIHDTNPRLYEIGRYGPVDISDEKIYDQNEHKENFKEAIYDYIPYGYKQNLLCSMCNNTKRYIPASINIDPPRIVTKPGLESWAYVLLVIFAAGVFAPIPMKLFGWEWKDDATNNFLKVFVVMCFIIAIIYGNYHYLIEYNIGQIDEPLSYLSGISAWPSFIMKILVVFISIFMLILMYAQLRKNTRTIDKDFINRNSSKDSDKTSSQDQANQSSNQADGDYYHRFFILGWKNPEPKPHESKIVEKYWEEYAIYGKYWKRILRSSLGAVMFLTAGALVLVLTGMPNHPYRIGHMLPKYISMPIIITSVFFQFLILYFVIDATKLSRRLINFISGNEVKWSEENCERFMTESGISIKEVISGLYKLKFIEEHTEAIGKFIYYPFIIIFLMVLSRNRYFDDWNNPIGLIIIFFILITYTVLSSMYLRKEARSARSKVLAELKRLKTGWITDDNKKSDIVMIDNVIDQIQQMNRGAYSNIANNPIIHAVLVPTGGLGIVTILQFLFRQ